MIELLNVPLRVLRLEVLLDEYVSLFLGGIAIAAILGVGYLLWRSGER